MVRKLLVIQVLCLVMKIYIWLLSAAGKKKTPLDIFPLAISATIDCIKPLTENRIMSFSDRSYLHDSSEG